MPEDRFRDRGQLVLWETAGGIFIITLGSLSHFLFDWVGQWRPLAPFIPVNESPWEHLKMLFWPGAMFYGIQHVSLGVSPRKSVTAAAAALYLGPFLTLAFFYSYTSFLGRHLLPVDIGIFIVAVAAIQLLHFSMMKELDPPSWLALLAGSLILLGVGAFTLFTFYPPEFIFFQEH